MFGSTEGREHRDSKRLSAREMADDLPALGDAVKAFVWSWYNPDLFNKKNPKDGK